MTNYFLPWIALTAQLPFENASPKDAFIGFCLALGSPALITYSLMITLLNRNWIRTQFQPLIEAVEDPTVREKYGGFDKRIEAALYLLLEAQQVSLRASQVKFWLSSLIMSPRNQDWWEKLKGRLKGSRRGFTYSLVAQILLAAFVWLFTIISSLLAAIGNATTALQIAAATLWIWLVCNILL
jgi:hypothetical protein